ncbi:hypothetical protein [Streptomyces uncialis]|nr:hypothetical protein OG268_14710 [Streptomyces uncialis]
MHARTAARGTVPLSQWLTADSSYRKGVPISVPMRFTARANW